jgi:hypothetical protein
MLSTSKALFRNPTGGGPGPTPTDPSFAYVPLLLNTTSTNGQQNNTFLDSSTNNFTITRNGTPTQGSITPYWPNGQWSNFFNGSTSLTVAASASQDLGTSDFTYEFFWYPTTISLRQGLFCAATDYWFGIDFQSDGKGLGLWASSTGSSWNLINSDGGGNGITNINPTNNSWNHIAVSRSGGSWAMWLNGNRILNLSGITGTVVSRSSDPKRIGFWAASYGNYSYGYFSNNRLAVGSAVYNPSSSTITVPTAPLGVTSGGQNPPTGTQTKLLTCQSNRFIDNSNAPAVITPNGTPTVQAFQPFSPTASYTTALYGGSGYFGGSPSYLSFPANSAMNFGTGDFTVEAWVYPTATPGDGAGPIGGATSNILFAYSGAAFPGKWAFGRNFIAWDFSSLTDIVLNTWTHLAVSRSSGTIRFFINGALTNSASNSNSYILTGGGNIGFNGASSYFTGYMSQIRAVGTAVYTGAFTPPTLAPISTTGPASAASYSSTTNVNTTFLTPASLLLNFTNAGIYDATTQNNLITVDNAQASLTPTPQWPLTSMKFDGSGDYLLATNSLTLSGAFTIDFWFYRVGTGGNYCFTIGDSALSTGFELYININGSFVFYTGSTAPIQAAPAPTTGAWTYVALTRDTSNVVRLYVNGALIGSASSISATFGSVLRVGVEFYSSTLYAYTNGSIQDFRITNGVARTITANPTAPFPTR